jgi:catechol 2,3-dioxygenase-like lactoylglutathione lyase family enzyme
LQLEVQAIDHPPFAAQVALDTVSGGDVAMRAPVVLELVAHEEQDQHGAAMYREEDGDGQHLAIVRAAGGLSLACLCGTW